MPAQARTYWILHPEGKHPRIICTKPEEGTEFLRVLTYNEHLRVTEKLREDNARLQGQLNVAKGKLRGMG